MRGSAGFSFQLCKSKWLQFSVGRLKTALAPQNSPLTMPSNFVNSAILTSMGLIPVGNLHIHRYHDQQVVLDFWKLSSGTFFKYNDTIVSCGTIEFIESTSLAASLCSFT